MSDKGRYASRGVSSSKHEVHKAISSLSKGLYPGAFCKIVEDSLTGNPEYALIMHADGAGTKSSLAWMYWKETGDLSVWKGIAQDALVMNTDDLLCAGAHERILVSSTIGRNKHTVPGEVIETLIRANEELCDWFRSMGIDMILTGGETADVGDLVRTIIVDTTVVSRLKRSMVIDNSQIKPGQVIVGLASYGQATYENSYNGGMGSNGLTSARHDMFHKEYAVKYPESYDKQIPENLVFSGKFDLTEPVPGLLVNFGQLVLSPTRTYAPVIKQIRENLNEHLHGMIHCSGGGQTKILHFAQNLRIVKNNMLEIPPLFNYIQEASGTSWKEMYKVFNMGHRMELYMDESAAEEAIAIAESFGIEGKVIGHTEFSEQSEVIIHSPEGIFSYT